MEDGRDDTFEIAIDFMVPKSQHKKAKASERLVPFCILQAIPIEAVLGAIDLNYKPCGQAGEINDIAGSRHLSPKVQTLRLQAAQMNPEFHFLWRHALAQAAGNLVRHGSALDIIAAGSPPGPLRGPPSPHGGEG